VKQISFRAAALTLPGADLLLTKLEVPPLFIGQVLIRLEYSGVCRSQLMEVGGLRGEDQWLPHLLGHEGSGTVLAVGAGVSKVHPGQEVICGWVVGDGVEADPAVFQSDGVRINAGCVTTFSEITIVSENRVYAKPYGLPMDEAVLFGCALMTGAGMVLNEKPPGPKDTVLVLGLGGVGMAALIGALSAGPSMVIAADPSAVKRQLALSLGATLALDSSVVGFLEQVREATAGGVDVCYEAAGKTTTIELGFESTKPKSGTLVFASHPPSGEKISIDPHALISGRSIRGSWGGGSKPDQDIPRIWSAVQELGIDLSLLISNRYALEDVNLALRDLESGSVMRPLLDMSL
jgi:S-(hydroxymethyl)glutathione dehydrogenase / alcohol dehydrogenase